MRPKIRFLSDTLIQQIIDEAKQLLCTLGVEVQNQRALKILSDAGAEIDLNKGQVRFTNKLIEDSIESSE